MIGITENYLNIKDSLAKCSTSAGRTSDTIRLLAVSKKKSVDAILEAATLGQRDFGENFVQEGVKKIHSCGRDDLIWHFIGHLQSNKTRAVAEHFHWVHTVDRLKIAARLSDQRPHHAPNLNICIEVNIDSESKKKGVQHRTLGPEGQFLCFRACSNDNLQGRNNNSGSKINFEIPLNVF